MTAMNFRTLEGTDKRLSLKGRAPLITLAGVFKGTYLTTLPSNHVMSS
jgi:hypothetical protein